MSAKVLKRKRKGTAKVLKMVKGPPRGFEVFNLPSPPPRVEFIECKCIRCGVYHVKPVMQMTPGVAAYHCSTGVEAGFGFVVVKTGKHYKCLAKALHAMKFGEKEKPPKRKK